MVRTPTLDALRRRRRRDPALFWLSVVTGGALVAAPLVVAAGTLLGAVTFGGVDFKAYYLAGLRARHGLPLYDPGFFYDRVADPFAGRYLYPPAVVLGFVPFTYLDAGPARALWVVGQAAFLLGAVALLVRALGVDLSRVEWALLLWAVLGFEAVLRVARSGNVSGVVAGLLALAGAATLARGTERPYLGGALTALAVVPKPFVAPAGAALLGDRRRLAGAALAGAGVLAVGLVAFGVGAHRAYLDVLAWGKGWGYGGTVGHLPRNYRPFYQVPGRLVIQGLVVVVVAATSLRHGLARATGRVRGGDDVVFALGVVTVPLAAPAANSLTLVVALPGLVVALVGELRRGGHPAVVVFAVLGAHVTHYALRVFYAYGPQVAAGVPWERIGAAVLFVQPATLGLGLVVGLLVRRAWRLRDAPDEVDTHRRHHGQEEL